MPPKSKFSKQDIIDAAFDIVRALGMGGLSTRSIAKQLNCSTMPIYSFLKSKNKLEDEIIRKAFDILFNYQTTPRTGDIYLDMGAGYVMFAKAEKHLFRCITDERHVEIHKQFNGRHFKQLIGTMSDYPVVKGLTESEILKFFLQGWTYSHGLANLVNTGYADLTEDEICELLVFTGKRYITGFEALQNPSVV